MVEIRLSDIRLGQFKTRISYEDIDELCYSIKKCGQQIPIKVRPLREEGKFELIYGYRRFEAAKRLGLETIEAEIIDATDEEALISAAIENLARKDLSDYEKALLFKKLHDEFNKTYEEIGSIIGKSKQYICNHIAMLDLFDEERIKHDPVVLNVLMNLTEHHARILLRIRDKEERLRIASIVVKFKLGVRETDKLVGRIRSGGEKVGKDVVEFLENVLAKPGPFSIYRNGTIFWRMKPRRRVVIMGAQTLNYLLSCIDKPKREVGREAAKFFTTVVHSKIGIKKANYISESLIYLSRLTGFGKFELVDDGIIVEKSAVEDIEFLHGYLETLIGKKLKLVNCAERNTIQFKIIQ